MKKELLLSLTLTVVVLLLFLFVEPKFLKLVELKTYDISLQLRQEKNANDQIAIVAIDEESLKAPELGRWPWSRAKIADIIATLNRAGAKVIALDIVFAEPDKTSLEAKRGLESALEKLNSINFGSSQIPSAELNKAIKVLSSIKTRVAFSDAELVKLSDLLSLLRNIDDYRRFLIENIEKSESDDFLANTISRMNNVVLGYYFNKDERAGLHESNKEEMLSSSKIKIISKSGEEQFFNEVPVFNDVITNIKVISMASEHSGFLNAEPDEDGIYRWGNLISAFNNNFYPSLALKSASIFLDSPIVLHADDMGLNGISIGRTYIQTDESGRVLINFYGDHSTKGDSEKLFPYYSAIDVINGNFPKDAFRDKVVFIGATAIGIYDIRPTPYDPLYPGVEIQATILSNIINRDSLFRPGWSKIFDVIMIILIGVFLGVLFPGVRALFLPVFLVFFGFLYYILNWGILNFAGVWLDVVYPTLEIVFVTFGVTIFKYLTEEKSRRQIKHAFQHYLSPNLVNEILKEPEKLRLGGEQKELTVLFSDIRNFTSIAERLQPETVVNILNEYLTPMTDIVFRNDGLLNKYMGDAIMAIFGAPIYSDKHPVQACNTAIEMIQKLNELNKMWEKENKPVLAIGIGINTGKMHVGNMGSKVLFDYTVIGDSVNLASRLEGINKIYGTSIIISEDTYEKVKDFFICRPLDFVRVKGKEIPVKIYELIDRFDDKKQKPEWVGIFETGLNYYKDGDFNSALDYFKKVITIKDDKPTRLFIGRCEYILREGIPEKWDGVYEITQK